jgi:hypothetical protein
MSSATPPAPDDPSPALQPLLQRLDAIEQRLERQSLRVMRQLEAFVQLHASLGPIPAPLHGWAISADLALLLLRLIEAEPPDLVLEFGSGVSTYVLLAALARAGVPAEEPGGAVRLLSFEHRRDCRAATVALLRASPLRRRARVRLAPLEPWREAGRGGEGAAAAEGQAGGAAAFSFYGGRAALGACLQPLRSAGRPQRLLVLVDGPPGTTGPLARYPALPLLLDALQADAGQGPPLQVDLLLDDLERRDERRIADLWQERLRAEGWSCRRREPITENGTLHLRWRMRL